MSKLAIESYYRCLYLYLFSSEVVNTMPMQNAALWTFLIGRARNFELYLPETRDDTVPETLREGWCHDVGRHDYGWEQCVGNSCAGI